jgi:hypothetical protein
METVLVLLLLVWHNLGAVSSQDLPDLGSYNVVLEESSISGFSSGAFMAVQFHMAHSATLHGAGISAGGIYYCAEGSLDRAMSTCLESPREVDVHRLVNFAQQAAESGNIDDTSSLAESRVYLISATQDTRVPPEVMEKVYEFYSVFVSADNLGRNYSVPGAHGQLTDDYGDYCTAYISPYINNCGYPSGYVILEHIYGDIEYADSTKMIKANFMQFNQSVFFGGDPDSVSMDTTGFVYVPTACHSGAACRLHIMLHGCKQGRGTIGDVFALHAGYNGVAEVNNIIVLYPQVDEHPTINPIGCWDWWGYTGKDYCYKTGPQVAGIKQMMETIAGSSLMDTCDSNDDTCS